MLVAVFSAIVDAVPGTSMSSVAWMLLQVFAVSCLTFASLVWLAKPKKPDAAAAK